MTHQYKKLPVTMKMWMQFNVMQNTMFANFSATTQLPILNSVGPSANRSPDLVWLTSTGVNHFGRVRQALSGNDGVHHGTQFN